MVNRTRRTRSVRVIRPIKTLHLGTSEKLDKKGTTVVQSGNVITGAWYKGKFWMAKSMLTKKGLKDKPKKVVIREIEFRRA